MLYERLYLAESARCLATSDIQGTAGIVALVTTVLKAMSERSALMQRMKHCLEGDQLACFTKAILFPL